jgi:hypothetical protein
MARYYIRNTPTERQCPTCLGAAELVRNNSFNRDPQREYTVACTEPACCDGWVRWAAIDPLEQLAAARAGHLRRNPVQSQRYGAAFAQAFSDVRLPQWSPAPAMPWRRAA